MAAASSIAHAPPAKFPQPSIAAETPRTNRTDGHHTKLTQLRDQIGQEMDQEFVECGFDDFLKAYMPFIPADGNVDACLLALANKNLITGPPAQPQLKGFNSRETPKEAEFFEPLQSIADTIASCTVQGRSCNYPYKDLHTKNVQCVIAGSDNKCDGYFKAAGSEDLKTTYIAVPCEYKVTSQGGNRFDNNIKVVSANVQIMNADVRRKFTFGITIENGYMTLWYLSRSHSAVSKPKNYLGSPKSLIIVFMSFMFATSAEIGYDPEVTLNITDDTYTYKMPPRKTGQPPRFFRTSRSLSEYRSNNITGRMARIWLAAEVPSIDADIQADATYCVLKDVWLEHDAKTEQELQEEIFNDIHHFLSQQKLPAAQSELQTLQKEYTHLLEGQQYKKYFLTIDSSSVGELSKPTAASATRIRNLFFDPGPLLSLKSMSIKPGQSQRSAKASRQGSGTPRPIESQQKAPIGRNFEQRKRYRVVFEEVCTTIGDLRTLGEVFDVAAQTMIPLQLLFCAGWVHRDISSGNILAQNVGTDNFKWEVKLSDLEYAKRFPPSTDCTAHVDPKTGTPFFMPHEILDEDYLFNEDTTLDSDDDANIFSEVLTKEPEAGPSSVLAEVTPDAPRVASNVVHNFQHDLESLWWILLWSLTSRVPYEDSKAYGDTIFQNTLELRKGRKRAFLHSVKSELSSKACKEAAGWAAMMEKLRKALFAGALDREQKGHLFGQGSYVHIHNTFRSTLGGAVDMIAYPWAKLQLKSHSAYLYVPSPVTKPNSSEAETMPPRRVLKRPGGARQKRGRGKDYTSSSDEDDTALKRPRTNPGRHE